MKGKFTTAVAVILSFALTYAICAFVAWMPNPADWPIEGRAVCAFIGAMLSPVGWLIAEELT
jgi:hypothetical protein